MANSGIQENDSCQPEINSRAVTGMLMTVHYDTSHRNCNGSFNTGEVVEELTKSQHRWTDSDRWIPRFYTVNPDVSRTDWIAGIFFETDQWMNAPT